MNDRTSDPLDPASLEALARAECAARADLLDRTDAELHLAQGPLFLTQVLPLQSVDLRQAPFTRADLDRAIADLQPAKPGGLDLRASESSENRRYARHRCVSYDGNREDGYRAYAELTLDGRIELLATGSCFAAPSPDGAVIHPDLYERPLEGTGLAAIRATLSTLNIEGAAILALSLLRWSAPEWPWASQPPLATAW